MMTLPVADEFRPRTNGFKEREAMSGILGRHEAPRSGSGRCRSRQPGGSVCTGCRAVWNSRAVAPCALQPQGPADLDHAEVQDHGSLGQAGRARAGRAHRGRSRTPAFARLPLRRARVCAAHQHEMPRQRDRLRHQGQSHAEGPAHLRAGAQRWPSGGPCRLYRGGRARRRLPGPGIYRHR